jgi:hypothetical protein
LFFASSISFRSGGNGKLPACVVKIRSLLRFMFVIPSDELYANRPMSVNPAVLDSAAAAP